MRAPLHVFVVEDSAIIRKRIIDNLRSIDGVVVVGHAESEEEAIEAIGRLRPDILVVDIRLREGNGIEVVRQVRADQLVPRPTIYVLTNYAYPEYQAQCLAAGADAFFDKSSDYPLLLSKLQQLAH